jgi:hypothetical protein
MAQRGRPPKSVDKTTSMSILQACEVMLYVTKGIPDFCISFDHKTEDVELHWHDEIYKMDRVQVPKAIEAIRFLNSLELKYAI